MVHAMGGPASEHRNSQSAAGAEEPTDSPSVRVSARDLVPAFRLRRNHSRILRGHFPEGKLTCLGEIKDFDKDT